MAWVVTDKVIDQFGAYLFTAREEVGALAAKTLLWPTDLGEGLLLPKSMPLEVLGVRTQVAATSVGGTRRSLVRVLDSGLLTVYEVTANNAQATSTHALYDFAAGFVPGVTTVELPAGGTVQRLGLPIGLFVLPGQRLVVTQEGASEVNTITSNASPSTGGTFALTVNGQTTTGIAFNATAAAVQAALEALSNVEPGDVIGVATAGANLGASAAIVTIRWGGRLAGVDVTISIDTSLLTGGVGPHVLATTTAGGLQDPTDTNVVTVRGRVRQLVTSGV